MKFTKLLMMLLVFTLGTTVAFSQSDAEKINVLSDQFDYYQTNAVALVQSGQMTKMDVVVRMDFYSSAISLNSDHNVDVDIAVEGLLLYAQGLSGSVKSEEANQVIPVQDWWGTSNLYNVNSTVYSGLEAEVKSLF